MAHPLGSVASAEGEPGTHQVVEGVGTASRAPPPSTEALMWGAAGDGGTEAEVGHSHKKGVDGAAVADRACGGSKEEVAGQ